ncbi:MAG TPA: helix-turn-helix domain-containing protein [Solirubrobacterales bacterium]|nr:helix-turn-helix domain-containing protein [Solirubrobacterales bacterium]
MPPEASQLISAVNHPLRRRILRAFVDGSVGCASADEVAELLDERVGQVAYHLKTLARGEILRPVELGARRGWDLGVEPEWLRVVLEIWVEAEVAG